MAEPRSNDTAELGRLEVRYNQLAIANRMKKSMSEYNRVSAYYEVKLTEMRNGNIKQRSEAILGPFFFAYR